NEWKCLDQDSIVVLNHPNWGRNFDHFPHTLMESLEDYHGIEIYNGVIERLQGSPVATDRWDRLLTSGKRIWGFGNDDSHAPEDVELAWNVVRVAENTPDAIMSALRHGSFYASTGVEITDIQVSNGEFKVETANAQRIRFITKFGIYRQTTNGSSATFALPNDERDAQTLSYVRAECYGEGGRSAWTQPIFFDVI
ncbi:MAG: phosphoesterase, partial [Candidatus Poribacteria bacterium]|nr:phosphoesterase [Candidatus Poribacteria bacterium]